MSRKSKHKTWQNRGLLDISAADRRWRSSRGRSTFEFALAFFGISDRMCILVMTMMMVVISVKMMLTKMVTM